MAPAGLVPDPTDQGWPALQRSIGTMGQSSALLWILIPMAQLKNGGAVACSRYTIP